jgi:hypothetical protein
MRIVVTPRVGATFRAAAVIAICAMPAAAQDATIIYRLGRDTVAVEQFVRTPTRLAGEMVSRTGPAVARTQYDFTLSGGRVTAAVVRRRQADGSPVPNSPMETRYTFRADSARREIVWRDSTQTHSFLASNAFPALPVFAFAPFELVYARGASRDSIPVINAAGNAMGMTGLQSMGGDTLRMRGGPYPMLVRFDRDGRLLSTDGSFTTNKAIGTRVAGRVDVAAIASAMKPTGALSPRATAYAAFGRSPMFINYGRPAVRERSVWGGTLVPFDTIWRAGANEATHFASSRTIAIGDMTLAPGLYTLWIQHTRDGTFLIVNRQVGQWGTDYQASQDIGRVKMEMTHTPEHVEDFTITIRPAPGNRGLIEFAWGDSVATATFTLRP